MNRSIISKIIIFFLIFIISSCSTMKTSKVQFTGIEEKLKIRDYAGAISQIESAKDKYYKPKEKVVYYLDLGMLYHYHKEYAKSNEFLSKAEKAIEELYTKSISRAAASLLLNDNVLEYAGEDYEDIYLNIFKALNYIELDLFDDAFVEIRRINNKLSMLEDKHTKIADQFNLSKDKKVDFKAGKNKFHNSALGRYLSLLLYRAEGKLDDARIDKNKIAEAWDLQSQIYNFPKIQFDNYLEQTNKTRIDVLSFIGKSPDKKANTLYIHTEKDLIVIARTEENPRGKQKIEDFNVIPWKGIEEGYHFKFQLPKMNLRSSCIAKVKVVVDNRIAGELKIIESIENVALETYKIKEPIIYLKTITRAIVKGLFAEKRKQEMEAKINNNILGFAARLATDALVDATENADLRISRFFPSKALIKELLVEPGIHHIKIEYYSDNNTLLFTDDLGEKEFKADKLNLLESYYLD